MGTILIVTEIQKGAIREASFELASIAQELAGGGQEVKSVVWGKDAAGAAEAFAKQGGGEVLLADHDLLADYNAEAVRAVIRAAIDTTSPDLVLISNTPSGWDVAPRIAAGLDAAFVTDCFKVTSEGSGFRLFTWWYPTTIWIGHLCCLMKARGTMSGLFVTMASTWFRSCNSFKSSLMPA